MNEEINFQEILRGLEYPATKQEIIEYVRNKGANDKATSLLEKISEREYQNPMSLLEEIGKRR